MLTGVARTNPESITVSRTKRRNPKKIRFSRAATATEVRDYLQIPAPAPTPPARPEAAGPATTELPVPALSPRQVFEEEVRLRAYLKWEAAGRPPGDGADFWLAAEQELRRS